MVDQDQELYPDYQDGISARYPLKPLQEPANIDFDG